MAAVVSDEDAAALDDSDSESEGSGAKETQETRGGPRTSKPWSLGELCAALEAGQACSSNGKTTTDMLYLRMNSEVMSLTRGVCGGRAGAGAWSAPRTAWSVWGAVSLSL